MSTPQEPKGNANVHRSERDWTEDFNHENGQYECLCVSCDRLFYGHKRRVTCRVCDERQSNDPNQPVTVVVIGTRRYELRRSINPRFAHAVHWWRGGVPADVPVAELLYEHLRQRDEIMRLRAELAAAKAMAGRLYAMGGHLLEVAWEFNPDIANKGFQNFGPYVLGMNEDGDLMVWKRPLDETTPAVAALVDYEDAFAWLAENVTPEEPKR